MDKAKPVVHLVISDYSVKAACGRWHKHRTRSAAAVTCPDCRRTWDFTEAERRAGMRKGAA